MWWHIDWNDGIGVNAIVSILKVTLRGKAMHYRLRCPIGFLNVQKKSKSKQLFLTEGISQSKDVALFVKIVTQILYQKYFMTFQKANMAKIMINVQKRLNGASAEADFWYGDNLDHVENKSSK